KTFVRLSKTSCLTVSKVVIVDLSIVEVRPSGRNRGIEVDTGARVGDTALVPLRFDSHDLAAGVVHAEREWPGLAWQSGKRRAIHEVILRVRDQPRAIACC